MATKPDKITPEEVFPGTAIEPGAFNESYEDDSPDAALMNALAEIGASEIESKVAVYRASPEKGNKGGAFLFSCTPSEFSLEFLRDTYGGGNYRIHIRQGARLVGNRIVTIEEPRRATLPAQVSQSPDFGKLIDAMQTGFNQLGALIAQANQSQRVDPDAMRRAMMQDMVVMKELFGANQSQSNNWEQAIAMLIKGMEIAKEAAPREGETGTMDVLLEAMKTFGKPIAEAALMARAIPQNTPALPAQYPIEPQYAAREAENPTNQIHTTEDEMKLMEKMYAAQILKLAEEDRDPYAYATLVLDNAPVDQIEAILNRSDCKEYLFSLSPKLANHGEWLDEFLGALRELLTDEENPSMVSGNAPTTDQSNSNK